MKQRYEQKAREIDVDEYWQVHEWNLQVIAARAVEKDPARWPTAVDKGKRKREDDNSDGKHQKNQNVKENQLGKKRKLETMTKTTSSSTTNPPAIPPTNPSEPFNPYEGETNALQINEQLTTFLSRLKPSTTEISNPWIFCANFNSGQRPTAPDIAGFKQVGHRFLDKILQKREELEAKFDPPKAEGVITRMMAADRANLESEIMAAAKRHNLTSGKWMLFPTRDRVDRYWEAVVRGTVDGRLGSAAKVATRPEKPEEPTQVICVYTRDVTDEADIKRVLLELVRLKLAPAVVEQGKGAKKGFVKGQIWYKPDCYTWLGITSGNEYKIKPTLYGTASLLTEGDVQKLG